MVLKKTKKHLSREKRSKNNTKTNLGMKNKKHYLTNIKKNKLSKNKYNKRQKGGNKDSIVDCEHPNFTKKRQDDCYNKLNKHLREQAYLYSTEPLYQNLNPLLKVAQPNPPYISSIGTKPPNIYTQLFPTIKRKQNNTYTEVLPINQTTTTTTPTPTPIIKGKSFVRKLFSTKTQPKKPPLTAIQISGPLDPIQNYPLTGVDTTNLSGLSRTEKGIITGLQENEATLRESSIKPDTQVNKRSNSMKVMNVNKLVLGKTPKSDNLLLTLSNAYKTTNKQTELLSQRELLMSIPNIYLYKYFTEDSLNETAQETYDNWLKQSTNQNIILKNTPQKTIDNWSVTNLHIKKSRKDYNTIKEQINNIFSFQDKFPNLNYKKSIINNNNNNNNYNRSLTYPNPYTTLPYNTSV